MPPTLFRPVGRQQSGPSRTSVPGLEPSLLTFSFRVSPLILLALSSVGMGAACPARDITTAKGVNPAAMVVSFERLLLPLASHPADKGRIALFRNAGR